MSLSKYPGDCLSRAFLLRKQTTGLSQLVESQSVMLATLDMFGVIALALGVASALIWLVPKPEGPIDTSGAH